MDDIEKLLRKISFKEREKLISVIEKLTQEGANGLQVLKVKNTNFFRVRSGRFRIIFHYEKNKKVVLDSIKIRNEGTYK